MTAIRHSGLEMGARRGAGYQMGRWRAGRASRGIMLRNDAHVGPCHRAPPSSVSDDGSTSGSMAASARFMCFMAATSAT